MANLAPACATGVPSYHQFFQQSCQQYIQQNPQLAPTTRPRQLIITPAVPQWTTLPSPPRSLPAQLPLDQSLHIKLPKPNVLAARRNQDNRIVRRGEHLAEFTWINIDMINTVEARAYGTNASSSQPTSIPNSSHDSKLNAAAPAYEPGMSADDIAPLYEPIEALRSVYAYSRYPRYRINKSCRLSDGANHDEANHSVVPQSITKARQNAKAKIIAARLQGIPSTDQSSSRYNLRSSRAILGNTPLSAEDAERLLPSVEGTEPLSVSRQPVVQASYHGPPRVVQPTKPMATTEYMNSAMQIPVTFPTARKLLIILDLNGTLLLRTGHNRQTIFIRPYTTSFIDYIFSNHTVMVYTSAVTQSAKYMLQTLLDPHHREQLAAVWTREKLDLTHEQYRNKVQVYKKLDQVWADKRIQASAESGYPWDQSNTILIDDSHLKAAAQPFNLLQIEEYTMADVPSSLSGTAERTNAFEKQRHIIQKIWNKLEVLKYQQDVSRLICSWHHQTMLPTPSPTPQPYRHMSSSNGSHVDNDHGGRPHVHLPTPESFAGADDEHIDQSAMGTTHDVDMPMRKEPTVSFKLGASGMKATAKEFVPVSAFRSPSLGDNTHDLDAQLRLLSVGPSTMIKSEPNEQKDIVMNATSRRSSVSSIGEETFRKLLKAEEEE